MPSHDQSWAGRLRCGIAAAILSLAGLVTPAHAQSTTPTDVMSPSPQTEACSTAVTLAIDAYTANPASTRSALRAFARAAGTKRLFGDAPALNLEGGLSPDHFVAVYKFPCLNKAKAAMSGAAWQAVLGSLKPSIYQRITVFASDKDHTNPSSASAACSRPAYFVLKGLVSDTPRYFEYLKALGASGILARYDVRREVVMNGQGNLLETVGTGYSKGEFFEILRFPCAQKAKEFWNSPEYRSLVPLRVGAMRADAWVYE